MGCIALSLLAEHRSEEESRFVSLFLSRPELSRLLSRAYRAVSRIVRAEADESGARIRAVFRSKTGGGEIHIVEVSPGRLKCSCEAHLYAASRCSKENDSELCGRLAVCKHIVAVYIALQLYRSSDHLATLLEGLKLSFPDQRLSLLDSPR